MSDAPRLTLNAIHDLIGSETYHHDGTLTICVLHLTNGATVTGCSNVISPSNYDEELGKDVSKKNAVDKIWDLEGYAIKTRGWPSNT